MLGKIREKLVGNPTESPLLFTPPGASTAPSTSHDPFGPLIKKRSTLPNDSMSSLQVTMQPVLFSIKESACRLLDHSGTSIASMRTTTTGWTHLASVLAGVLSTVGMNIFLQKVPFDQHFKLAINEGAKLMLAERNSEYASLARKFKTSVAALTSISVTVGLVINLTIYLRKPIYQFCDSKGNIQLLARHERDRKSILIEYTKLKNEENIDLKFIMKLNVVTDTWELYSDVNKSHTKPVFLLPAIWKRGDSFYTDRKDFTIDITSITKYSLKIFDTRYVMPLTNASERQYLQFKEHNDVPRDVLAFVCYIARTANTMPTDFLIYMSCLAAFTFLYVKLAGGNKSFDTSVRAAQIQLEIDTVNQTSANKKYKEMVKNLWEFGLISKVNDIDTITIDDLHRRYLQAQAELNRRIPQEKIEENNEEKQKLHNAKNDVLEFFINPDNCEERFEGVDILNCINRRREFTVARKTVHWTQKELTDMTSVAKTNREKANVQRGHETNTHVVSRQSNASVALELD